MIQNVPLIHCISTLFPVHFTSFFFLNPEDGEEHPFISADSWPKRFEIHVLGGKVQEVVYF